MREPGLESAIGAAGGMSALARALGLSQPTISNWRRIPAERVSAVEIATGLPRAQLRPDLFADAAAALTLDEIDAARAQEYDLLAALMGRAPKRDLLSRLSRLKGDATPLGLAHLALARAAQDYSAEQVEREYFNLFIGVGRGELLPFASYYLTGFLHDRPLARVREDMVKLGVLRAAPPGDPEDHIAFICEIMAALIDQRFDTPPGSDAAFFARHVQPWAERFFADLERAKGAAFYRAVGKLGGALIAIETEAFSLDA